MLIHGVAYPFRSICTVCLATTSDKLMSSKKDNPDSQMQVRNASSVDLPLLRNPYGSNSFILPRYTPLSEQPKGVILTLKFNVAVVFHPHPTSSYRNMRHNIKSIFAGQKVESWQVDDSKPNRSFCASPSSGSRYPA
jgi:hypothetical protein